MNLKIRIAKNGLFRILPNDKAVPDEALLYRAILDRFLLDCFSPDPVMAREAKSWFSHDNEMFHEVVDLSLLDYDFVVKYTKRAYQLIKSDVDRRQK